MGEKIYPFSLKIDCHKMTEAEMNEMTGEMVSSTKSGYLDTKIIGEDTIFVTGEVTKMDYEKIWDILDKYNVIID